MKNEKENKKKGLFGRLIGNKKANNCCGGFEIEEIPEEELSKDSEISEENSDKKDQKSGGKVLFSTSFPETPEIKYQRMLRKEGNKGPCC